MTREQWEEEKVRQIVFENKNLEYVSTFIWDVEPKHKESVCEKLVKILKETGAMAR